MNSKHFSLSPRINSSSSPVAAWKNILAQASGDDARTVIAGYHWFTDWGRDTMISLEGLTLCTGRYHENLPYSGPLPAI